MITTNRTLELCKWRKEGIIFLFFFKRNVLMLLFFFFFRLPDEEYDPDFGV
jgi:hypothetical protein